MDAWWSWSISAQTFCIRSTFRYKNRKSLTYNHTHTVTYPSSTILRLTLTLDMEICNNLKKTNLISSSTLMDNKRPNITNINEPRTSFSTEALAATKWNCMSTLQSKKQSQIVVGVLQLRKPAGVLSHNYIHVWYFWTFTWALYFGALFSKLRDLRQLTSDSVDVERRKLYARPKFILF